VSCPARSASVHRADLRTGLLPAALIVLALALGGCGGEEPPQAGQNRPDGPVDISGTDPVGQMIGGSAAPLAMCAEWNGASERARVATIADVRAQLAPQDSGITAPALTDEEAGEMFDNACKPSWAAGFRLYKLYARAAGFVELEREIEEQRGG
jgi:hypothetical protein